MGGLIIAVVGMLLSFLASGMWIAIAVALVGIVVLWVRTGFDAMMNTAAWHVWYSATNFTFSAVPIFIFMGFMLVESGLAKRIYSGLEPTLNHLPGGLLHTNIVVGALFASASGSSIAAAATIGSIALPEMEKRGYPFGISVGSVAAGGVLAPLIPPSIMMILYCMVVDESVGQQFIAGILPGAMLVGLFMLYIAVRFSLFKQKGDVKRQTLPWPQSLAALKHAWLILFLILIVLGSIYLGVATPTEAAAMGAVGSIILAAVHRNLNWTVIKKCALSTMKITASLHIIFIGIKIMSGSLAVAGVVPYVTNTLLALPVPPLVILLMVFALFLFLGMFIEGIPMMLMVVPIVFPTMVNLGYDPLLFGVMVVLLGNSGNLTPPVGVTLFVLQSLKPDRTVTQIYQAVFPFLIIILVGLALITAFPQIVLFLPNTMAIK